MLIICIIGFNKVKNINIFNSSYTCVCVNALFELEVFAFGNISIKFDLLITCNIIHRYNRKFLSKCELNMVCTNVFNVLQLSGYGYGFARFAFCSYHFINGGGCLVCG